MQAFSFKELDEALGRPKGSGFRLFKSVLDELREGEDFVVLHHRDDADSIEQLKAGGRIYPQSVNVVLLSGRCFEKLRRLGKEQSE